MITHSDINILCVKIEQDHFLTPFIQYLQPMPHVRLNVAADIPDDLSDHQVVVTAGALDMVAGVARLQQFVSAGGGWLHFTNLCEQKLPEIFGAQPEPVGPSSELRVLFDDSQHPMAVRLSDAIYVQGRLHQLNRTASDVELILYADWHYTHRDMCVRRSIDSGQVACTTLQDFDHSELKQILYRLVYLLSGGTFNNPDLGVAILGYAPSVGLLHGLGIMSTPGLSLRAACDLNPERLNEARRDFPDVKTLTSADDLNDDPDIDLVIVATAPNSHAQLCLQMLTSGKHVICEKPLAITRQEADALVQAAADHRRHLSCHQNRRWDVDYLAIKQVLTEGSIGELFYIETFVGSFAHPCGYWHSHASVSGGTTYDWGAHYLDWIVSLIPEPVQAVIGTRHKRVWHDVTNADHERIQIRFADGREAEFIHSDIAAYRKPKWYMLGTQGAIVGHWQDITSYKIDPVLYYHPHDIPATEMPPDLTLFYRSSSGQIISQKPALPIRQDFAFHRNLADYLLIGEPLAAPLQDSVKVVAILEAAARSAANGGTVEILND